MKARHLQNAPIKEAVIEIQFQPSIVLSEVTLEVIKEKISAQFNEFSLIKQNVLHFNFYEEQMQNNQTHSLLGAFFRNTNKGYILKVINDRIALSKIEPYIDFDSLRVHFFEIYEICKEYFADSNISRIAVRYINEIKVKNDIDKYIKHNENILSQNLQNKNTKSYHSYLLEMAPFVTAQLQAVSDIEQKHILIDIDCFSQKAVLLGDRNELEPILEDLRKYKNEVFFDIVTEDIERYL